MGLDIKAYKNLKIVENPQIDEDGELENQDTEWEPGASMEWSEKHFPGRGEGIEPQKVYSWEDSFSFRAGSYSGYGWWRSKLKEFAKGDSFQELINFADNEGVIGYVVSKKLLQDFIINYEKAKEFDKSLGEGKFWLSLYEKWKTAFEFASEKGAVEFR